MANVKNIYTYIEIYTERNKEEDGAFYFTDKNTATKNVISFGACGKSVLAINDLQKFPSENMNSSEQLSISLYTVHRRGNV